MASYKDSFTANVQYNDWKGTAAADNSDHSDIHDLLVEQNLISDNDFLLSVSLWSGEGSLFIHAFILENADGFNSAEAALQQSDPIPVREANLELTQEQFFGLFKRFNIVLCNPGLNIDGREFLTKG